MAAGYTVVMLGCVIFTPFCWNNTVGNAIGKSDSGYIETQLNTIHSSADFELSIHHIMSVWAKLDPRRTLLTYNKDQLKCGSVYLSCFLMYFSWAEGTKLVQFNLTIRTFLETEENTLSAFSSNCQQPHVWNVEQCNMTTVGCYS